MISSLVFWKIADPRLKLLVEVHAAVRGENLSCGEAGKHGVDDSRDGRGHLFGLAEAAEESAPLHGGDPLVRNFGQHRRADWARRNGIGAHTVTRKFKGSGLRHRLDRAFGGRVVNLSNVSTAGTDGRKIDYESVEAVSKWAVVIFLKERVPVL